MKVSLSLCGLLLVCGLSAHADSISIFNTGVDASGTPLPDSTVGDPHYTLISVPGGSTTAIAVRTSVGGYPIGPWIGDDAISAWIGPINDPVLDGPLGLYDYQTTFDLTGMNITTASLTGNWASDNEGVDILINGVSTGQVTTDQFLSFTPFSINSGFVAGINTLDFIVNNDGGPTGLRVEVTGTAMTPEPGSSLLLGAGLGLCLLRRFRRRTSE